MGSKPRKKVDPLNELRQRRYEAGHGDAEAFEPIFERAFVLLG